MKISKALKSAILSRFTEEKFLELFSLGKLNGTVHTCIGQEFSGAAILQHIHDGDFIFSNHRCHGHFLSSIADIDGLMAELMGRSTGVSGGLGGSQHIYKKGFFSNGIQGGIVPVSAGLALGQKLKGEKGISVVFIGDGTLGEGVIYEAFNLVSKWSLPLLIVLEDNKYSQSTSQNETLSGNIEARLSAFGIETAIGSTWEFSKLEKLSGHLIASMRKDSRPRFLRVETFRLKAHSKGDDTRPKEMIAPFEDKDPLNIFLKKLAPSDLEWVDTIKKEVENAVKKAEQAPFAILPSDYFTEFSSRQTKRNWQPLSASDPKRFVVALNETFAMLMQENSGIFMLGEDILSPYGGAFKATKGLSDLFPDRVRNTPISEACIVGMGAGLGLFGLYPIVEIMFGDFLGLAFDQLVNHAAKFHQMYNQQVNCNLIVRTPMGAGRGYGPTHGQTLDKHFLGVPGLKVVALNPFTHPELIYRPLISPTSGPTLVIENKLMYASYLNQSPPIGFSLFHSDATFPDVLLKPHADHIDFTLLGYGGTAEMMIAAANTLFEEHDLIVQVLIIALIYPFSITPYKEVIREGVGLVIVEEGQGFAGFGSEVLAQLADSDSLHGFSVRRVMPSMFCIPSSSSLEKEVLPNASKIITTVLSMRANND